MPNNRLVKALGIGALVLTLGTGLISCEKIAEAKKQREPKRIELKVSECRPFIHGAIIQYAGMNTEKTFSLCLIAELAVNQYYPAKSKEINFYNNKVKVIEVTPEYIILEK